MRLWIGLTAALLLAFPAAAGVDAASGRFDLDCQLQHTVKRHKVNVRRHLRVDLEGRRWCEDLCEQVGDLEASADDVTLNAPPTPIGSATDRRVITLSRKSGRLRDEHKVTLNEDLVSVDVYFGPCRLRPYTGVNRHLF